MCNNFAGYTSYSCEINTGDLAFCSGYASPKPMPVPSEFITLADILMAENGWRMPQNCAEALELYLDLLLCIQGE